MAFKLGYIKIVTNSTSIVMGRLLTYLFLIGLLIFSCTPEPTTSDEETAAAEIDQLYKQFSKAYDRLDTEMVANLYAADGLYLVPNPRQHILEGRASIRDSFAGFIENAADNNRSLDISFRIIKRQIADSLAFDVGYYRTRSKPDTAAAFPKQGGVGKFVTVMGLMPDGSWTFLLDGYNPAPPEAFEEASSAYNPLQSSSVTN
jgi:ketosteroid isomerase-like protein